MRATAKFSPSNRNELKRDETKRNEQTRRARFPLRSIFIFRRSSSSSGATVLREPKVDQKTNRHVKMAPSAAKAELATDQEPQMHVYKTAIKLTNCRTNLSSNKPPTTAAAQTKQDSKLLNNNPQTTDTCQAQLSGGEEIKFIGSQRIYRHFVELFKPRCEHCNCLILDEECTEAEGEY